MDNSHIKQAHKLLFEFQERNARTKSHSYLDDH